MNQNNNNSNPCILGYNKCEECGCESIIQGFCDECGNFLHLAMQILATADDYSVSDLNWEERA